MGSIVAKNSDFCPGAGTNRNSICFFMICVCVCVCVCGLGGKGGCNLAFRNQWLLLNLLPQPVRYSNRWYPKEGKKPSERRERERVINGFFVSSPRSFRLQVLGLYDTDGRVKVVPSFPIEECGLSSHSSVWDWMNVNTSYEGGCRRWVTERAHASWWSTLLARGTVRGSL